LREFAARELPDYLRPAAYMLLEHIPRTASGKVDRRRLPSPGHQRPELSTPYAAPGSELEKTTERVWRDVLGLDRIGIDDSFFDLGGNSLGVVTLAAKLGKELGREISVVTIFEHPTVRAFAARVAAPSAPSAVAGRGARGAQVRDAYRHHRHRRVARGRR
jgi:acyl carrier protein